MTLVKKKSITHITEIYVFIFLDPDLKIVGKKKLSSGQILEVEQGQHRETERSKPLVLGVRN